MALRLSPLGGPDWIRKAADTVNLMLGRLGTAESSITTNTAAIAAIEADMPHTAPVTVTADATIAATTRWLINNKAGSACALTLPAAADHTGREITVQTIQAQAVNSASSNVVPLGGGAAGTAIVSGTAGRWATLVSDGTNWVIMAGVI